MEINSIKLEQLTKNKGFWLWVALSALIAINLTIFTKMNNIAHAGMSALYWLAVYSLLWDRRKEITLQNKLLPCIIGGILIAWTLYISRSIPAEKENNLLSIAPFVFSCGLALIASGFNGFKQFRGELLIIFFLGVPRVILNMFTDISPLTARVSSFILHYLGFEVLRQGVFIHLPQGSVKVYEGCSGIESVTYVLGLSVICLIMFPVAKKLAYTVPLIAILIGFFVNAFRVVLMAILVGMGKQEAFIYWHEGDGSLIFGMIAVSVFAGFYWCLMNYSDNRQKKIKTKNKKISALDSFFEGEN